jgi:hypothetical protein
MLFSNLYLSASFTYGRSSDVRPQAVKVLDSFGKFLRTGSGGLLSDSRQSEPGSWCADAAPPSELSVTKANYPCNAIVLCYPVLCISSCLLACFLNSVPCLPHTDYALTSKAGHAESIGSFYL